MTNSINTLTSGLKLSIYVILRLLLSQLLDKCYIKKIRIKPCVLPFQKSALVDTANILQKMLSELMADSLNAKSLAAIDNHVKEDNKNNNKFLDATPGVALIASEFN